MDLLLESFTAAIHLIFSFDPEMMTIVWVSIKVSILSTIFSSIIAIPVGFFIAFSRWPGKRIMITVLNTLMAMPTVVIGLFIYTFISRRGVFGPLDLLYTQKAIIIGQIFLIIPIIISFTISAISSIDSRYRRTAQSLGANAVQVAGVVMREARFAIMAAVIAAYGRVLSEIGISMMLGGNIKGFTRTMTTAMALEYDKGSFVLAIALGLILMALSFIVNFFFHFLQGRVRS